MGAACLYDRIEQERKRIGVSRKDLCQECGIPYNSYNTAYKRHCNSMDMAVLSRISQRLNVPIARLVGHSDGSMPDITLFTNAELLQEMQRRMDSRH